MTYALAFDPGALAGERVEMTFEITQAKLRGGRSITLRSSSCEVAGKEMYITLKAAAQNRPVQIYICAEAPRWTPVRIDKVSISAGVAEELGTDGAQLDKPESVALEVNRDISEDDPVFGGELMCHREGTTRIEYDDDDSDAESEYEYEDVPATRADLLTGVDDDGKVCISAHFRVRKNNKVTVLVQED